ncbi:hypothetical protein OPT61_g785 [Boeremia exigua]|uniref:Uncharacterized protein n=1 Tax=Boeremia exigua TaxID=749465 RepID=A0ACC2ISI9_9PLEO|nr:hypothetical protein OPT61_g785 [Boeremia exigua]
MFDRSIDLWEQVFLVNATPIYFVTAAFLPLLSKSISPTGQISKAASVHTTRQLAFDFSHENIKIHVNGIAPGWLHSEMTIGGSDDNNKSTSQEESALQQEMVGIGTREPPGRIGKPEDLASGLLMLATNEYIWGMDLVIDGGILQSVAGNI